MARERTFRVSQKGGKETSSPFLLVIPGAFPGDDEQEEGWTDACNGSRAVVTLTPEAA